MTQILTLTTDFGLNDYYIGVVKGVVLSINPEITVVDINNNVEAHDILGAAINIKNSYKYFPKGTIHLVVVDPGVGGNRRPIIVKTMEYYFVGPDNGVFTFIYGENSYHAYEITNEKYFLDSISSSFHARDIFAPVCAHLTLIDESELLNEELKNPVKLEIKGSKKKKDKIVGEVLYIDHFGNMITNIKNDELDINNEIMVGGISIGKVSSSYSSAEENQLLAIYGSSGFLEIAENQGRAIDKYDEKPIIEILIK